jgi:L-asparagine transporter-like permease
LVENPDVMSFRIYAVNMLEELKPFCSVWAPIFLIVATMFPEKKKKKF